MKSHFTFRPWILTTALVGVLTQLPLLAAPIDLATFAAADSLKPWKSVNDGVMGGVSKGGFKRTEESTLLFSGELSLANNGGFASIRTEPGEFNLAGTSALVVKARGDGRTYWVDLRVTGQMGGSSYRAYLPTSAGKWQETRIPLADFKLQAFGQALSSKAINPAEVSSIGFTLADKKEGPFSLEIESIKRGVPLFNKGDTAACAAVYEVTCEALQIMAETPAKSRADLAKALAAARAEKSPRQQAWILRAAMDRAWTCLQPQDDAGV